MTRGRKPRLQRSHGLNQVGHHFLWYWKGEFWFRKETGEIVKREEKPGDSSLTACVYGFGRTWEKGNGGQRKPGSGYGAKGRGGVNKRWADAYV